MKMLIFTYNSVRRMYSTFVKNTPIVIKSSLVKGLCFFDNFFAFFNLCAEY